MADPVLIAEAIATQVALTARHDGDGELTCTPDITDTVNAPCAAVMLRDAVLDEPTSEIGVGLDRINWSLILYVTRTDDAAGMIALKKYLRTSGECSIREAILSNQKLGGLLKGGTIRVNGWDPPGDITVGATTYLGVEMHLSTTSSRDVIARPQ